MSMTKKDYKLVANAIISECFTVTDRQDEAFCIVDDVDEDTLYNIVNALSNAFQYDNDKFNKDKFLKGCGL